VQRFGGNGFRVRSIRLTVSNSFLFILNFEIMTKEKFTRVNNDVNGNPRYVFHFLELADNYETALKLAKKIGGRKFHNKQYGGGIVVQSYNLEFEIEKIKELKVN
jgi:hypothetical protein